MAVEYTPHDELIRDQGQFFLGFATDEQLNAGALGVEDEDIIQFQFPPKVLSDNKRANWTETETFAEEPVATLASIGARQISVTWTYIIDGGQWPIGRISREVKKIRGYFNRVFSPAGGFRSMVVFFRMWDIGGDDMMTGRLLSVNVKHGETVISDFNFNSRLENRAAAIYPLRTDITIDLRLWTKGKIGGETTDVQGLINTIPPAWY